MILALNLPDLFYAYMAWAQPQNFFAVSSMVFIEQFGYGGGFVRSAVGCNSTENQKTSSNLTKSPPLKIITIL